MKYVNQPVTNAAQKMRLKMTKYTVLLRSNPKQGYRTYGNNKRKR